jgi:hypothetical protein
LHYQWQSVCLIPAAIAFVVTMLFMFFFSEKNADQELS